MLPMCGFPPPPTQQKTHTDAPVLCGPGCRLNHSRSRMCCSPPKREFVLRFKVDRLRASLQDPRSTCDAPCWCTLMLQLAPLSQTHACERNEPKINSLGSVPCDLVQRSLAQGGLFNTTATIKYFRRKNGQVHCIFWNVGDSREIPLTII